MCASAGQVRDFPPFLALLTVVRPMLIIATLGPLITLSARLAGWPIVKPIVCEAVYRVGRRTEIHV